MNLRYNVDIKRLDRMIAEGWFINCKIFIFGYCAAAELIIDYLNERGFNIAAILDNNVNKHGNEYMRVPITAPDSVNNLVNGASIVLIATRFYAQMSAQLKRLGYKGRIEQIIKCNSAVEYSVEIGTVNRRIALIHSGKETLIKIKEQYPDEHLIVCPLNAIGDAYVSMSYMPEYLNEKGIKKCIAVVNGESCLQVATMFGVKAVCLDTKEMDNLVQAIIFTHEPSCILAHHDRVYTDISVKWLNKHKISFYDYYKQIIYGLPQSAKQTLPMGLKPFNNLMALPQGKTVIVAPYAKSIVGLADEYWQEKIKQYKLKGYTVCTNVSGNENALAGTVPLSFPLNQAIAAVEYAGTFIGIRSGLCDIIDSANCEKTVIFPDRYYSSTEMKLIDFWGLSTWEQVIV
jgi:hypothetical protein